MYLCSMVTKGLLITGVGITFSIVIFTITLCAYAWNDISEQNELRGDR